MDKTVKVRALPEGAASDVKQGNPAEEHALAQALSRKSAQLEEEKTRSLDYIKTIEKLQTSLRQEQAKNAEMAAAVKISNEREAKIKELSEALDKIMALVSATKAKIG